VCANKLPDLLSCSGFNIADFLTLKEKFETMMGFTGQETEKLIDEIYRDYEIDPATRPLIEEVITANYNGYRIVDPDGEGLFNSTILMYFMREFIENKKIPDYLIDVNLKTDISWVKRLTASNPANTDELVNRLLIDNRLSYNRQALLEKFNMSQFFEKSFYPISFYYLGMLTKRDDQYMCLPNLNMKSIFADYFNEINKIDVSTRYAELMAGFINQPDIPGLFGGYWELYVSQLPVPDKMSQFQPPAKDIEQLKGYEAEWKKQHPGPGNKSFLVYCFGNQGFRVFPV
jgi:hypothetical protein